MISLNINTKCADCGKLAGFNAVKVLGRSLCASCRMKSVTCSADNNDENDNLAEYEELGYSEPEVNEETLSTFQKLKFIKYIANETGMSIEKSEVFLKSIDDKEKTELINAFTEQNNILTKQSTSKNIKTNTTEKDSTLPICPKCESQAISVNTQKYGVGKALVGTLLTGGIGLLAGGIGRNNVNLTCLSCGNRWQP